VSFAEVVGSGSFFTQHAGKTGFPRVRKCIQELYSLLPSANGLLRQYLSHLPQPLQASLGNPYCTKSTEIARSR